ncbi:MAG: hypothetical protein B6245_06360 [Desulfobacteraceae bacterium 4572_88]|nr:MAG: hypothetical protein B6245_06360 [Desulfobacteraceae bacterium 4572_88]
MNSNLIDTLVSLVWVAFALIWILARFWKGLRGEKKKQDAPPPLPRKKSVQKSGEPEAKQPKILRSDLEDFFEEVAKLRGGKRQETEATQQKKASETSRQASPADAPSPAEVPAEVFAIAEAEPDDIRSVPMPFEKTYRFPNNFRLSGEEWQQAVVLSEILGAPIALRDGYR